MYKFIGGGFTYLLTIEGVTNFVKMGVEIYWRRVYLFRNNNRRGYRFRKNECENLLGEGFTYFVTIERVTNFVKSFWWKIENLIKMYYLKLI